MKTQAAAAATSLGTNLQGMWWLESRIDRDAAGQRRIDPIMGADPLGVLCFSSKRFSAQFMRRDRSQSADPTPARAGVNNSSAVNGYDAYFGSYTLDEARGLLRTRLEGAVTPANVGSEFERRVEIRDGKLVITLPTTAADGTPVTRTLTWVRAA